MLPVAWFERFDVVDLLHGLNVVIVKQAFRFSLNMHHIIFIEDGYMIDMIHSEITPNPSSTTTPHFIMFIKSILLMDKRSRLDGILN